MAWGAPYIQTRPKSRKLDKRPSSTERGYDKNWKKFRLIYLNAHPLCLICKRGANEVDHIKPLARGGSKYDESNLRPLCKSCHSTITYNYCQTGINEMPIRGT